jgi:hypothetical protein
MLKVSLRHTAALLTAPLIEYLNIDITHLRTFHCFVT